MAIAYDTVSDPGYIGTTTSPYSYNHTVTGSNTKLFVATQTQNTAPGSDVITGITYNGVAMTKVSDMAYPTNNGIWFDLYYLDNPATGTHSVSVSFTNTLHRVKSTSYTGCGTGIDGQANSSGSAVNTIDNTIITTANNSWHIIWGGFGNRNTSITAGGTVRTTETQPAPLIGDSNAAITPAGSHTITITASGGTDTGDMIGATFAPFVPPPTPSVFDTSTITENVNVNQVDNIPSTFHDGLIRGVKIIG